MVNPSLWQLKRILGAQDLRKIWVTGAGQTFPTRTKLGTATHATHARIMLQEFLSFLPCIMIQPSMTAIQIISAVSNLPPRCAAKSPEHGPLQLALPSSGWLDFPWVGKLSPGGPLGAIYFLALGT